MTAGLPDRHRGRTERVVAGQPLTGQGPFDTLLHTRAEVAGLDQLHEHLGHVAEIEEVALPLDLERSVLAGGEPEPAAADAVDLVLGAVGLVDDLLPEADDLAQFVVYEYLLVLVDPVLQAFHLQTQCDVADF